MIVDFTRSPMITIIVVGTRVLVQCDNVGALSWAFGTKLVLNPGIRTHSISFTKFKEKWDVVFETRHVKGHQSNSKGARYFVNNWVDREARKMMRECRKQLGGTR